MGKMFWTEAPWRLPARSRLIIRWQAVDWKSMMDYRCLLWSSASVHSGTTKHFDGVEREVLDAAYSCSLHLHWH